MPNEPDGVCSGTYYFNALGQLVFVPNMDDPDCADMLNSAVKDKNFTVAEPGKKDNK